MYNYSLINLLSGINRAPNSTVFFRLREVTLPGAVPVIRQKLCFYEQNNKRINQQSPASEHKIFFELRKKSQRKSIVLNCHDNCQERREKKSV